MKQPKATTIDLGTAFWIAIALHVLVIIGLSFSAPKPPQKPTLDVTFTVNTTQTEKPETAKHVAAQDQAASGTAEAGLTPSTTEQAVREGLTVQETQREQQQTASQEYVTQVITTTAEQLLKTPDEAEEDAAEETTKGDDALERQLAEIRALEARLAREQQAYAERPKIHRFTSVAALAASDAEYQLRWQEKVESIGNANYPSTAVEQGISGDVTLMVSLNQNGTIKTIQLIKSSGYKLLDQSAITSVKLAAPFQAFPRALAAKADILEIYRTWQFRNNSLITVDG